MPLRSNEPFTSFSRWLRWYRGGRRRYVISLRKQIRSVIRNGVQHPPPTAETYLAAFDTMREASLALAYGFVTFRDLGPEFAKLDRISHWLYRNSDDTFRRCSGDLAEFEIRDELDFLNRLLAWDVYRDLLVFDSEHAFEFAAQQIAYT